MGSRAARTASNHPTVMSLHPGISQRRHAHGPSLGGEPLPRSQAISERGSARSARPAISRGSAQSTKPSGQSAGPRPIPDRPGEPRPPTSGGEADAIRGAPRPASTGRVCPSNREAARRRSRRAAATRIARQRSAHEPIAGLRLRSPTRAPRHRPGTGRSPHHGSRLRRDEPSPRRCGRDASSHVRRSTRATAWFVLRPNRSRRRLPSQGVRAPRGTRRYLR